MEKRALHSIKPRFNALLQMHGFEVVETHDADSFGDSCAVVASDDLRLRFILDKGHLSVDVGSAVKPATWYDMDLVKSLIEGNATGGETLDDRASFLEKNYSEVCRLFEEGNVDTTEKALKRLKKERAEQLFPQAFNAEDERDRH
jgi:hypothetical protein